MPTVGAYYSFDHGTHTAHIRVFLSVPDTARDEGISANGQTQHQRTANIWLAVTSSNALFLRRIAESSHPRIIFNNGQGGYLSYWRLQGCKTESRMWLRCTDLYYARGVQGVLPMRVESPTSQLDPPSVTPLSVAGCGRLQLGVPQWATSVDYCK